MKLYTVSKLSILLYHVIIFMPPTSEEVDGAYWFGSVRASVRAWVRLKVTLSTRSRTLTGRMLKFGVWFAYEN